MSLPGRVVIVAALVTWSVWTLTQAVLVWRDERGRDECEWGR